MREAGVVYGTGYFESNCNINIKWTKDWVILSEVKDLCNPSLTNTMSSALWATANKLARHNEAIVDKKVFQWCPTDGLFRITFKVVTEYSNLSFYEIQWEFISKDMNTFNILYV